MHANPTLEQSVEATTKNFVAHEIREALRAQKNNADYKSVEMITDDIYEIFSNRYKLEINIPNN